MHGTLNSLDESIDSYLERVRTHLLEALADKYPTETLTDASEEDLAKIAALLEANDLEDAYEFTYGLIRTNDLSDTLFLCLAYTNQILGYPDAAAKYAAQASKLHDLVGAGTQSELLKEFAAALSKNSRDLENSRIVVNDRFVNFYPGRDQLEELNAVDTYIMEGLIPDCPFLTKEDTIITVGSCFTGNVSTFLRHNGFHVPSLNTAYQGNLPTGSFSDEVFNTFVLRYLFEQAFGDAEQDAETLDVVNQHNRRSSIEVSDLREQFAQGTVFIITLGISEVWYNKLTGEVYKTAKSVEDYDPDIHDFRLSTTDENLENIAYVYDAIRSNNKDAQIIFTLSPVPLKATFRPMGATVANSVSKAILRVALDTLMNQNSEDNRLHYFPSYELITDCLHNPFGKDRRYIIGDTTNFVMTLFARHYVAYDKLQAEASAEP